MRNEPLNTRTDSPDSEGLGIRGRRGDVWGEESECLKAEKYERAEKDIRDGAWFSALSS